KRIIWIRPRSSINSSELPMHKRLLWIAAVICVIVLAALFLRRAPRQQEDRLLRLMTRANAYLEKGDASNAVVHCLQVVELAPENLDAHLNLANAYLLARKNPQAIEQCQQALSLDH